MRNLHLYEYEWIDPAKAGPRNVLPIASPDGGKMAYKILGKSMNAVSNERIRQVYNYLCQNGNNPYMEELPNGDIRIQYFRWPRGQHWDKIRKKFVPDEV